MSETAPELRRLQRFLPFDQFEWVEVSFTAANADQPIEHHLRVESPSDVHYIEFARRAVLTVWDGRTDPDHPCPPWTSTRIYLRSTTPGTATLLLVSPRGSVQRS